MLTDLRTDRQDMTQLIAAFHKFAKVQGGSDMTGTICV